MDKSRLQYHSLHLQLITFTLLGILILPSNQSYPNKSLRQLQAERILESTERIDCSQSQYCEERMEITKAKITYSLVIGPGSVLALTLKSNNDRNVTLDFKEDPFENTTIHLTEPISVYQFFNREFSLQQQEEVIVPGPVENLQIAFINQGSPTQRVVTLTVSHDNGIPAWVIPVAASVGGVIAITIVAVLYKRRLGLNRQNIQRRNAQAVPRQYQSVELGSAPPSPRQARQQANRGQRPQALPTLKEAIDICYPEANFAQFESSFPQKTCTVCLDDMQENQPCRQLECQHIFHTQCAKKWLEKQYKDKKKAFCPNCNKRVSLDTKKSSKKKKPVKAAK